MSTRPPSSSASTTKNKRIIMSKRHINVIIENIAMSTPNILLCQCQIVATSYSLLAISALKLEFHQENRTYRALPMHPIFPVEFQLYCSGISASSLVHLLPEMCLDLKPISNRHLLVFQWQECVLLEVHLLLEAQVKSTSHQFFVEVLTKVFILPVLGVNLLRLLVVVHRQLLQGL